MKTTPITERTRTLCSQAATAKKRNAVAWSLSVVMTVAAARAIGHCVAIVDILPRPHFSVRLSHFRCHLHCRSTVLGLSPHLVEREKGGILGSMVLPSLLLHWRRRRRRALQWSWRKRDDPWWLLLQFLLLTFDFDSAPNFFISFSRLDSSV